MFKLKVAQNEQKSCGYTNTHVASEVPIMPTERASQEEQNGANLSFVAPSSEELWVRKQSHGLRKVS